MVDNIDTSMCFICNRRIRMMHPHRFKRKSEFAHAHTTYTDSDQNYHLYCDACHGKYQSDYFYIWFASKLDYNEIRKYDEGMGIYNKPKLPLPPGVKKMTQIQWPDPNFRMQLALKIWPECFERV